ncbi:BatA domain-containing protein [Tahibacter sp. UC22_41]|uniref:BatA domain-containing protein n=1 Tax=Tahibacter sp. UC22_41 TaxID=3350178 RepID=UPI0036D99CD0
MSLSLLLPLGLTALLALAIPLLLHLNRRQEPTRTPFAALRWIRAAARPRRRLRLDQWPLLVLRMALLAALALLLAAPARQGATGAAADWVVVAPGVDAAQARALTGLPAADWHWLAPNFPSLSEAAPAADTQLPLASLLRELDSELPAATRLHVVVPAVLQGLDGSVIRLSRAADWRVVDAAVVPPPADAASASTATAAPVHISLRERETTVAATYLRAAIAAGNHGEVERYRLSTDQPDAPFAADTRIVFWLAGGATPALQEWVTNGGTALLDGKVPDEAAVLARDADGAPLLYAQSQGRGRLLSFRAAIAPQSLPLVLDAKFADLLLSALQPPADPMTRAPAAALQPVTGAVRADAAATSLASPLILLIAILALIERALSLYLARRRA